VVEQAATPVVVLMKLNPTEYDARYLAGIMFFNDRDFFQAHEVWEDLWADTQGADHHFYQGLIQAAVGLHHFSNGNVRGAVKLFHSSLAYMRPYPSPHVGINVNEFWEQMRGCFEPILDGDPSANVRPDASLIPTIRLEPEPEAWPDLVEFEHEDD
jgi:uncharacterized protein